MVWQETWGIHSRFILISNLHLSNDCKIVVTTNLQSIFFMFCISEVYHVCGLYHIWTFVITLLPAGEGGFFVWRMERKDSKYKVMFQTCSKWLPESLILSSLLQSKWPHCMWTSLMGNRGAFCCLPPREVVIGANQRRDEFCPERARSHNRHRATLHLVCSEECCLVFWSHILAHAYSAQLNLYLQHIKWPGLTVLKFASQNLVKSMLSENCIFSVNFIL